jgi:hypothetical protein
VDQPAPPPLNESSVTRRFWHSYVTDVRDEANERAAITPATDRKMVLVFVTTAIALTLNYFLSDGGNTQWLQSTLRAVGMGGVADRLHDAMLVSVHREWNRLAFWAIVVIATYVIPPVLLIKLVLREKVLDYGLRIRGIARHGAVYAFAFTIAAPVIVAVSYTAAFWPYMYGWWILYWLQFVALEFFFRGFLLNGLVPRLGYAAIYAMVVPYNMLHFGKPMAEALAAIVGGVALGHLALKTKSIWWGAALHISIAITMDIAALGHLGRIF